MMHSINWHERQIILASQSPRRRSILQMVGFNFRVHEPQYIEETQKFLPPRRIARRHAIRKAQSIAQYYPKAWLIGADTIVVKNERILGKPSSRTEAIHMLKTLAGTSHYVFTGYCLLNSENGKYLSNVIRTTVYFHPIPDHTIEYYVDHDQPYDKAGAYAIQDFSAVFVKKINGCFYNVVGFPLPAFYEQVSRQIDHLL